MSAHAVAITYRNGRLFGAYYHLGRRLGDRVARSVEADAGLVVDYAQGDRPIGIEIAIPDLFSLEALNRGLRDLGREPASREDVGPLIAA